MRTPVLVLAVAALACLALTSVVAFESSAEVEWVEPMFVETLADAVQAPDRAALDQPAAQVAWEKPTLEDIAHRDHRQVHVTLMAQHLDMAHEHQKLGNGVGVIRNAEAADAHNQAALMHKQAQVDVDYVRPAVKLSNIAYKKTRALIPRVKRVNMRPEAFQPTEAAKQALALVQPALTQTEEPVDNSALTNLPFDLAPASLEERQYKRTIGKD